MNPIIITPTQNNLSSTEVEKLFNLFRALDNDLRLKIIFFLHENPKVNGRIIERKFDKAEPEISSHLKILKENNLILFNKVQKAHLYFLNSEIIHIKENEIFIKNTEGFTKITQEKLFQTKKTLQVLNLYINFTILNSLNGGMHVTDLYYKTKINRSTCSQALGKLRGIGFVSFKKDGKNHIYSKIEEKVGETFAYLAKFL